MSKPLKGISKIDDHVYRINCECTSDDHTVDCWIEIENEDDVPMVNVEWHLKTWTPPFCGLWERIRTAYDILVKGVSVREHSIIMDREAAGNFAKAFNSSLKEIDGETK